MVVTDIDDARLARAAQVIPPEEGARQGVQLVYMNTAGVSDPVAALKALNGGKGYDDVMVFAPVRPVVEQGDALLGIDGCMNFFAGPSDQQFSANFNFYNVHYNATHIVGTSGGNTDDLIESLDMMAGHRINPASMITHVGGLNAAAETTLHLPHIPGGKKLIYTHVDLPLTALADFGTLGKDDPFYADLAKISDQLAGQPWEVRVEKIVVDKVTLDQIVFNVDGLDVKDLSGSLSIGLNYSGRVIRTETPPKAKKPEPAQENDQKGKQAPTAGEPPKVKVSFKS
jgi:hypothetical protein